MLKFIKEIWFGRISTFSYHPPSTLISFPFDLILIFQYEIDRSRFHSKPWMYFTTNSNTWAKSLDTRQK